MGVLGNNSEPSNKTIKLKIEWMTETKHLGSENICITFLIRVTITISISTVLKFMYIRVGNPELLQHFGMSNPSLGNLPKLTLSRRSKPKT